MKPITLLILYALLLVCSQKIFALQNNKGSLHGSIKDSKTNNIIEGASVFIIDSKVGSSTNSLGEYYISNIKNGKHLIEVSHIGYATIAVEVEINGETNHNFLLFQSVLENNAVIVMGTSKAATLKTIPFQVSIMRKQDLLQSSSMNIIESITKKAGVSALSTGPAISKPLIRGLGYNRVITVNDGVRQEGQQWGDEHGIEIDEASVSKIEVLKGPASFMYGSDAVAGVINIISNVPAPLNTSKVNFGSNYQTNNHLRNVNGSVSVNKNGFNYSAYGTYKGAGAYRNKYDGYVFNSNFNEHNFGGHVGYNSSWGYSHLLLSNFDLKAGLIEGERDDSGYFVKTLSSGIITRTTNEDFKSTEPSIPYQHIRHFKVASDNNLKIGENLMTLNLGWQQNRREEFGYPENENIRSLFFNKKTFTYTSQFHFKEYNGWKNAIGINGMNQTNQNLGLEQLVPDYHLFDAGAFLFSQKEIKKINFSGGLRIDNRFIETKKLVEQQIEKGDVIKKTFSNFSGSLGLSVPFNKHTNFKFNIAKAFRAPGISELCSNGAHEGTTRYEYGDKNLKSEISVQTDGAFEWTQEHFSINIAGYLNQFNNFIFYRKLQNTIGEDSIIDVEEKKLTAYTFDQKKATLAGLEITVDIHPHPLDWLHIENSFSFVRGWFQFPIEGSKNLPFIPAPRLQTELRADVNSKNKSIKNSYVKVEVENTFQQNHVFLAYNTETITKGYTLFNLGIGSDFFNKKNKQIVGIYLTASNIFDVPYQSHVSRLKYASENKATGRTGVYNLGRNFGIKVNLPLEWKL